MATETGIAIMSGIPVVVAEDIKDFSEEIPKIAQKFLKKFISRQLPISEISSKKITELNLANFAPVNLSTDETTLLQSLVEKLLESLKFVKMTI